MQDPSAYGSRFPGHSIRFGREAVQTLRISVIPRERAGHPRVSLALQSSGNCKAGPARQLISQSLAPPPAAWLAGVQLLTWVRSHPFLLDVDVREMWSGLVLRVVCLTRACALAGVV